MKTNPAFLKYIVILFLSCSCTSFINGKQVAPESSTIFNSLTETISYILFEYMKRITPTDNLTYLVINAPDTQFKQVEELVKHGANPNACIGDTTETLVQRAVATDKLKIARALINSGAAIMWISKENITAIFEN